VPQPTSDVVALVQQMIRNRCVNDGSPGSGQERRNADLLQGYLEGAGLDVARYEAVPGRANLVARIEGSDPAAPTLLLLGHTDVVPVNEAGWSRDPFAGDIVDGTLWGRGAVDMFNLTASMAVAMKRLALEGWKPRGTLVYAAVADEEALGRYGAEHLTLNERDAVRCDFLITESGGFPMPTPAGVRLPVLVTERGPLWSTLRVRGTPGHGSLPFGTDNALVKAAEVVRRIAAYSSPARIDDVWRAFVKGFGLPPELTEPLLRPEGFDDTLAMLPPGLARMAYSCTHTTIAPTMLHAGSKLNVIPDDVEIQLDIRTLDGVGRDDVLQLLSDALGDLYGEVEVNLGRDDPATTSPADTPLWDALERASRRFYPGAGLVPMRMVGATDARFFRRHLDTVAYGFGLFSTRISIEDLATMAHGDDERVDLESLDLVTDLWEALARDFLG
jgi:acetylornithine deacetylase/succinyl-diaminopimelate desuccinylase-like protein